MPLNGVAFLLLLKSYLNVWDRTFSGFWGSEHSGKGLKNKWEHLNFIKFNECVNSFLDDLVKRPYNVDE